MKLIPMILTSLLVAQSLFACGSESTDPNEGTPQIKQTLVLSGDCTASSCGIVPSSLEGEAKVICDATTEANCTWSGSDGASVSYRACDVTECASKPSISCPQGTTFASQNCGSENDGPCSWTTTCVPPRETTPCPEVTGCDELPLMEIGVICADGSTGGFACVTDGRACFWERNCD